MDSVVLKITYNGVLHRVTLPAGDVRAFSHARLQSRAREVMGYPDSAVATFTYLDRDGDVVALETDADVADALVVQGLNPLRIAMTLQASEGDSPGVKQDPKQSQRKKPETAQSKIVGSFSSLTMSHTTAPENVKQSRIPGGIAHGNSPANGKSRDRSEDQQGVIASKGVAPDADIHRRIKCDHDDIGKIVHCGITCDKCQVTPIQGPRFQSYEKDDYDLCSACYKKLASDGKEFVHNHSCDGCGMRSIRGPLFNSAKDEKYNLCLGCFDALDEVDQGQFMEKNRGFYRIVYPTLDTESLTRALTITKTDGSLHVVHSDVECDECGMSPIQGHRIKSYERRPDYDLCLGCYKRGCKKDDIVHIHRGFTCNGCDVLPIIGHRYMSRKTSDYDLCGECFAARDEVEQAGYVGVHRGFYWLEHPALVATELSQSQSQSQKRRHMHGITANQMTSLLKITAGTMEIVSNLTQ